MVKMNFLSGLLESLFNKKISDTNFNFLFEKKGAKNLDDLFNNVAQAKGEVY